MIPPGGVMFTAEVPGRPVPQSRPRVTRGGVFYLAAAAAHRTKLAWAFRVRFVGRDPISQPVDIHVEIVGARMDSDLDNHAKMVMDALVSAQIIAVDSVAVVRGLVCIYKPASARVLPCTRVVIYDASGTVPAQEEPSQCTTA